MFFLLKWLVRITFWPTMAVFLHYTLPQQDVVRVTDTYEKRVDFSDRHFFWVRGGEGVAEGPQNRDVFFIQTFRENGTPMVYRNEDTGWGWPPYFKFSTANLQARAADLISQTGDRAQWAMIRHYGWRNELFSIYPNAISIRAVAGPDTPKPLPWANFVILGVLLILYLYSKRLWRRFLGLFRRRKNSAPPEAEQSTQV